MGSTREPSWGAGRISAAVAFIGARLRADFADTGLPRIDFRNDPSWAADGHAPHTGTHGWQLPSDVIVQCGGHEFPLGLEHGVESACAAAADALQDDVIGRSGQPWPELRSADGVFVGVLEPRLQPGGLAHWRLHDEPFCAVGHLAGAVAAAGLAIVPVKHGTAAGG
ncbi:MAG TPA: hypothetical protein VLJ59_10480 [Mycobacteriales bacterium]|nr:hypothetical protein [Mycobacteriales bacterium]